MILSSLCGFLNLALYITLSHFIISLWHLDKIHAVRCEYGECVRKSRRCARTVGNRARFPVLCAIVPARSADANLPLRQLQGTSSSGCLGIYPRVATGRPVTATHMMNHSQNSPSHIHSHFWCFIRFGLLQPWFTHNGYFIIRLRLSGIYYLLIRNLIFWYGNSCYNGGFWWKLF